MKRKPEVDSPINMDIPPATPSEVVETTLHKYNSPYNFRCQVKSYLRIDYNDGTFTETIETFNPLRD